MSPGRGRFPSGWRDADAVLLHLARPERFGTSELAEGVEIDWASPGIDGRLALRVTDDQLALVSGHDNPHQNRIYWVAPATREQHAALAAALAKRAKELGLAPNPAQPRDFRFVKARKEKQAFGDDHVPVTRENLRAVLRLVNGALPRDVPSFPVPEGDEIAPRALVSFMAEELADWLRVPY